MVYKYLEKGGATGTVKLTPLIRRQPFEPWTARSSV